MLHAALRWLPGAPPALQACSLPEQAGAPGRRSPGRAGASGAPGRGLGRAGAGADLGGLEHLRAQGARAGRHVQHLRAAVPLVPGVLAHVQRVVVHEAAAAAAARAAAAAWAGDKAPRSPSAVAAGGMGVDARI